MSLLALHEVHAELGARFTTVSGGAEAVADYGDAPAEYAALTQSAGALDLGFRGRLCLTGADRVRLLHGQVTNDVQSLRTGQGCYAALVTAKGRMQADLNIYALADELLLDFEPGLTTELIRRFEHYIVADDVQVIDVAPHYGLLSVQGPRAAEAVAALDLGAPVPAQALAFQHVPHPALGDLYVMRHSRCGSEGCDLFIPEAAVAMVFDRLVLAVRNLGGRAVGLQALETARIEAGIPRFGVDMDETNLAPEAGIESRAISYQKGCYIGQEVIARLRTYGQVSRALRGLRFPESPATLPVRGDKLIREGKEVGHVTSAIHSPRFHAPIALGYVRRECNTPGTTLAVRTAAGEIPVQVVALPFA